MRWPDWLNGRHDEGARDISSSSSSRGEEAGTLSDTTKAYLHDLNLPKSVEVDLSTENGAVLWQTVLPALTLTATTLLCLRFYKSHLRRIPNATHIKPSYLRTRSLYGYVTSVGDGDNFRLFHTPGGRFAGWGWMLGRTWYLPSRSSARSAPSTTKKGSSGAKESHYNAAIPKELKDQTIHVRIAGIDAPELAHFGRPSQPGGQEALDFLRSYVLHRYLRVYLYRRDQYERVVASVYIRTWGGLSRKDVGLVMLDKGLATVYEAKFGSEFGNQEDTYRHAEAQAKRAGLGIWKGHSGFGIGGGERTGWLAWILGSDRTSQPLETPRMYKERMKEEKASKGGAKVK